MRTCNYQWSVINYQLTFRRPAATSRGVYAHRQVWYVILTSPDYPDRLGVGECAPLPGLSCDDLPGYEALLTRVCRRIEESGGLDSAKLRPYPSILFGLETAFRHFEAGSFSLWDTPFSRGRQGIPINGLIWMGSYRDMLEQVEDKLKAGFRCIKLKIGAIGFDEELALLRHIRKHFTAKEIELRVDANGAFAPTEAMEKLKRLAELDIHSIEQPIRSGQWEAMAGLAMQSPIPIALDEELTGLNHLQEKRAMLDAIRPQYIILKPSLHGGFGGCAEWIREAEERQAGWWITSALESDVGLNAIAQWCATLGNPLPQGLGTGEIYRQTLFSSAARPPKREAGRLYPVFGCADGESSLLSELSLLRTSGSTGEAKVFRVQMEQMRQSARLSCAFLGLRKGDRALLCMPLQYVGAKMMMVRTLVAGLNLWVREASGHPLAEVEEPFRFVAMLPLQVYNSLQVPIEKERLRRIEILIIGGGAIDAELEKELRDFPNEVYSTYGMTETLSHIALRRLNGREASAYYTPFPSVCLSLSEAGTLVVDAAFIPDAPLVTNDLAELFSDGRFRILGRKDNVINSGGIKLQIESLEEKLRPLIPVPFAITSVPDPKLGEALVLLIEKGARTDKLEEKLSSVLSKYERPRVIFEVNSIPLAGNGKINRSACRELTRNKRRTEP
jgi:o-succinylbenzoate synthase